MLGTKLLLIACGAVVAHHGWQQHALYRATSAGPVAVDVAAVERGQKPASLLVKLGAHLRVYDVRILAHRKSHAGPPTAATPIKVLYHPVISEQHPVLRQIQELKARYPDPSKLPPDVQPPALDTIAILVKTHRFETVGAIPATYERSPELTGLAVNLAEPLPAREKELIRRAFPKTDPDTVLVVEEGRVPAHGAGFLGLGVLMVVAGVISVVWKKA